ncbi:MAG TPA: TonB-dependent receptor plug domain-containing protein [Cyclobacteriaceae bacterium]|nr:TonB-dependent receptor plug domain-containing protein [Cyclobacteriaceae bacterium]
MKSLTLLLLIFLLPRNIFGQTGLEGRILDEHGLPLKDVNVAIKNSNMGANTDPDGYFFIELENGDYIALISSLGYKTQMISFTIDQEVMNLNEIHLVAGPLLMDELVVSGSRTHEKITESPASVNLIKSEQFENFTGSPEELFGLQKGVDFARIGNFLGSISIRGFNSAFNQKMLLLDDNRIAQLRIRTPVGPLSAFVKEDIERVEIVLGPSSALYGPNCLNGLFYTVSKSPFEYQGTTVVLGAGSNELLNVRMRHAHKINNKWAYKATFEYLSGVEEDFTDSVYLSTSTPGKAEVGLDRNVLFLKGLVAAFYKPTDKSEIGINYAFNKNNSISAGNRNNLIDWYNASLQVTYKSPRWYAQFYKTWIKLDQGVNTQARTMSYYRQLAMGASKEEAFKNSENAASFEDDSYRINGEIQYNNNWGSWNVVAGTQYQKEVAASHNTIYLDEPVRLDQIGIYGQLMYTIEATGIKVLATARGDNHSLFGFNFLPKTGITYTQNQSTWRLTYGEGYATPTLVNTYFTAASGTILGNSDGFTRSNGSKVAPIEPETLKTLEVGYKSIFLRRKLFMDMDAYYNWAENLISPLTNIVPHGRDEGPVVKYKGDKPITDFTHGLPGSLDPGESISSFFNYGRANTYGFDVGLNYYFSDRYNLALNYSFFNYSVDQNDLNNDVNEDGKVDNNDMAINTPKNKLSAAFNARINKFYGTLFARWVQKYDFFSGRNVAAATNPENIYNGSPVIEGKRVGTGTLSSWNYGPLGGFYLSFNGNYQLSKLFNIGAYVNNIVGRGNYEFVPAPPTETTFGVEIKVSLRHD